MSPILCPHCGTANRAGSYFCNRCGASLRGEAESRPPQLPPGSEAAETPAAGSAPAEPPRRAPGAADRPPGAPPAGEQESAGAAPAAGEQPWLQPGFTGAGDVPDEDVDADLAESTEIPTAAGRLVSGVQGLIEPIRVATVPGEGDGEPAPPATAPAALNADQLRRVRLLMAEEPLLAAALPQAPALPLRRQASLWLPWAFLLLGLAAAIPVFWQLVRPAGTPRQWPGVEAAFGAVAALPPRAAVQVFWAYDPATAGELDLAAAPLLRHLLDQGAELQVVSLLPNGPATAQRLLASVQEERAQLRRGAVETLSGQPRFLPGGVLALPLLGGQPADLAVVFAAQAEDVQEWLEQVAPRNRAPVIAATGAGADPVLRPYLASGQLAGLVSGYDGAASYTALLDELPVRARERQLQLQIVGQNLGTVVFLFLIAAGNLALLINGRRSSG